MNEKKYKEDFRKDVCFQCPKRMPCALYNSICDLVTPCVVCEIKEDCTSLCDQMEAYIQRGNARESAIPFSRLRVPAHSGLSTEGTSGAGDSLLSYLTAQNDKNNDNRGTRGAMFSSRHIPWGAITEKAETFLVEHFIHNKTYDEIALKYKTKNSVVYKTIHGDATHKGALAILKDYAELRQQFIAVRHQLPKKIKKILHLHLFKFLAQAQIGEIIGVSQERIAQSIKTGKKMLRGTYKVYSGMR